jgi:Tat protein secretion system quality control protein TatD with DNase activity
VEHTWSGSIEEVKKCPDPTVNRKIFIGFTTCSLVTIPTELKRLARTG